MSKKRMKKANSREEYRKKFDEQMNIFNYIMQDGESIVQCKAPYPDYWFISNKGYLFSAYFDKVRIIKPNHRYMGTKNKDGIRTNQDWYYTYAVDGEKYNRHVVMHKIMAEHFLTNSFGAEKNEVHHIRKKLQYSPNEGNICNSADNLQLLPVDVHKNLTKYAGKTSAEYDRELEQKLKDSGCPSYQLSQESFMNLLMFAVQQCNASGEQAVMYTTTMNEDVADIEAEAHLLKIRKIDRK